MTVNCVEYAEHILGLLKKAISEKRVTRDHEKRFFTAANFALNKLMNEIDSCGDAKRVGELKAAMCELQELGEEFDTIYWNVLSRVLVENQF